VSDTVPNERREHARIKVKVPVQLQTDHGDAPIRGTTVDLSLSGCYIETIFPFPVGTNLELQLSIETTVLIVAIVATCDPQVGNGIRFVRMLPEDRITLEAFLKGAERARDSELQRVGRQPPEQ
jgi:hypothetical protein